MARICLINKEKLREQLAAKYREKRMALKAIIKSSNALPDEKDEACGKLVKLKRDSSICRQSKRCKQCGRSRGVYNRRFKLCRLCLRSLARQGLLPGLVKSSW